MSLITTTPSATDTPIVLSLDVDLNAVTPAVASAPVAAATPVVAASNPVTMANVQQAYRDAIAALNTSDAAFQTAQGYFNTVMGQYSNQYNAAVAANETERTRVAGIEAQVVQLQTQVATLETERTGLQAQLAAAVTERDALQTANTTLSQLINAGNSVAGMDDAVPTAPVRATAPLNAQSLWEQLYNATAAAEATPLPAPKTA